MLREDFDPSVCRPAASHRDGTVDVRSTAALYNPAYYAVVGLPLHVTTGELGAWLVRGVGALLGAGDACVGLGARDERSPDQVAVGGAPRCPDAGDHLRDDGGRSQRARVRRRSPPVVRAAERAAHPGDRNGGSLRVRRGGHDPRPDPHHGGRVARGPRCSPHWSWGDGVACARPWPRAPRAWTAATAVVALAVLVSVAWTLLHAATAPRSGEPLVAETKAIPLPAHAVLWVFQTIGVMPNRFGLMWPVVYALGLVPVVLVLVLGVRAGDRRDRSGSGGGRGRGGAGAGRRDRCDVLPRGRRVAGQVRAPAPRGHPDDRRRRTGPRGPSGAPAPSARRRGARWLRPTSCACSAWGCGRHEGPTTTVVRGGCCSAWRCPCWSWRRTPCSCDRLAPARPGRNEGPSRGRARRLTRGPPGRRSGRRCASRCPSRRPPC